MTQHPDTHLIDATCATCGTPIRVRSAASSLSVDVCSSCHPAYTGVERRTATGSRIERFERRLARAA